MRPPSNHIIHKEARTLNTNKREVGIIQTTKTQTRRETQTIKRRKYTGTRIISRCISRRVPRVEMMDPVQMVDSRNRMASSISKKAQSKIIIRKATSRIRSTVIVVIIISRTVIGNKAATTSSRIKTRASEKWAIRSILIICNSSSTSKIYSKWIRLKSRSC